jgi:hypothetical protein
MITADDMTFIQVMSWYCDVECSGDYFKLAVGNIAITGIPVPRDAIMRYLSDEEVNQLGLMTRRHAMELCAGWIDERHWQERAGDQAREATTPKELDRIVGQIERAHQIERANAVAPEGSGEAAAPRPVWRTSPPTVDEVRACQWWWNRQGDGDILYVLQLDVDIDGDGIFDLASVRMNSRYDDHLLSAKDWPGEWCPCLPPDGSERSPSTSSRRVDGIGVVEGSRA